MENLPSNKRNIATLQFICPLMPSIVLATLNARYHHASLGLRYLAANMGEHEQDTQIMEFILQSNPEEVIESILAAQPRIVGFGVYIWNVVEITRVVALLKCVAPEIIVVLGGPEVSYECEQQEIVRLADYVITGWGDISFAKLCRELLQKRPQAQKIIAGLQPQLAEIKLPYALYNDNDIANRTLYVEASRGCPFKCEFCLSSLDKTAWAFDFDLFLGEMAKLYAARRTSVQVRRPHLQPEHQGQCAHPRILSGTTGRDLIRAFRGDPGSPARPAQGTNLALPRRFAAIRGRHPDVQRGSAGAHLAQAGHSKNRREPALAERRKPRACPR